MYDCPHGWHFSRTSESFRRHQERHRLRKEASVRTSTVAAFPHRRLLISPRCRFDAGNRFSSEAGSAPSSSRLGNHRASSRVRTSHRSEPETCERPAVVAAWGDHRRTALIAIELKSGAHDDRSKRRGTLNVRAKIDTNAMRRRDGRIARPGGSPRLHAGPGSPCSRETTRVAGARAEEVQWVARGATPEATAAAGVRLPNPGV